MLSESEVESLLRGHAAMETVSKEQAQSDVSLLFRALQSAYGAYEYFGQEKFDAAEDAVTQWLSSQDDEIKVLRWEKNCRNLSHSCLRTTRMP